MPRKRFTNEQIAFGLWQAENGPTVDEVCRKMGVSEPTFYRWKTQFVGACRKPGRPFVYGSVATPAQRVAPLSEPAHDPVRYRRQAQAAG